PRTISKMVEDTVSPTAGADLVEWMKSRAIATDPQAAIGIARSFASLDFGTLLLGVHVPVRCINAAVGPPVGRVTQVQRNRRYADFDAVVIEDVGHYPMLEKPQEFNAKLRELLRGLKIR